ncbi:hypothetical protein [Draconibacterium sediminis]|uniref:Lipoprotein n=1 Tax=Draconibacterium sediminis TaxID=1544798 RepID=A0A0D8JAA4_9BACT|nr:hypothetical protein [Draconibacterium sediminis]KJF43456.1 hypothetical protein LH29_14625 [Draconibacterium sediminis]
MSKIILFIISFTLLLSCSGKLTPRHYKSPEKFTGGFNDFKLNLEQNGQLELLIETSIEESQNEAGATWSTRQKRVTGNWTLKNQTIKCNFNEPKDSIDMIFKGSPIETFVESELIRFNDKLDTVYIYGIPCIEADKGEN